MNKKKIISAVFMLVIIITASLFAPEIILHLQSNSASLQIDKNEIDEIVMKSELSLIQRLKIVSNTKYREKIETNDSEMNIWYNVLLEELQKLSLPIKSELKSSEWTVKNYECLYAADSDYSEVKLINIRIRSNIGEYITAYMDYDHHYILKLTYSALIKNAEADINEIHRAIVNQEFPDKIIESIDYMSSDTFLANLVSYYNKYYKNFLNGEIWFQNQPSYML